MNAGRLNQRIRIEAPEATRDEIGQPIDGWALVAEVWADVRVLAGLESIRAGAVTSASQASIRIRPRAGINSGMRAVRGSTVYSILAVAPSRDHVDLVCEAVNVES